MQLFGRKSLAAWRAAVAVATVAVALAGCAGAPATLSSPAPAWPASEAGATAALDAELLYDLLLADLAAQRGQNAVAIDAATRAAYRSRNRRVTGAAIRLANRAGEHARVIELSRFMATLAPGDSRNQLTLAGAQLKTGQVEAALAVLAEVARRQPADESGEAVLQSVAEMLAEAAASATVASGAGAPSIFRQFEAAADAHPASASLQLAAALLALELHRGAAFQRRVDRALQLQPGWQSAAMFKLAFLAEHFAVQSARFADAFLREFPGANRFRVHHARLLLDAGQAPAAAAQAAAAVRQNPQNSEALFVAASAYFYAAKYTEAQDLMRRYLALNPRNDRARLYLADILSARADYDGALEVLREVASPAYRLDAEVEMAAVLAKRSGVDAGIRHLRQIATANREHAVRLVLEEAALWRDYDLPLRAKAALDDGLARFPAQPDLLYNRGLLAAQLNQLDLHERDMRQLIALQPDNAHAYNALGYTLADQTPRLDEAFKLIDKALKLRPNDPFILDSMGWVHFRLGDTARAIDYLQRALAVREDAEIAAHLGEALWAAGRRDEARAIWAKGRQWGPDNTTLLDTLRRFVGDASS